MIAPRRNRGAIIFINQIYIMNQGWIKLHRTLQDNKLWYSEPLTKGQAWVDLILLANHKD